jgi:hypothetical protein
MVTLPLDLSKIVALHAQYVDGGRYERDDRHLALTTTTGTLPFGSANLANGGARQPFPFARAELRWSPLGDMTKSSVIALYTVTDPAAVRGDFKFTLTTETDGPGSLDIWGVSATGVRTLHMRFGAWIDRNGTAKDHPLVIVQNSDFDWVKLAEAGAGRNVPPEWAMVLMPKSQIAPRLCPLPKGRPILPVPTIDRKKLTRIAVVPGLDNDTPSNYRPALTKRGIVVTDHIMSYFISQDMNGTTPRLPMVDGPRGKASGGMFTFAEPGRGWKRLCCEPYAGVRYDEEGARHTVFGLRSLNQDLPRYWQDATWDDYELVGVYPEGLTKQECTIRNCWAWRFYPPSLALDDTAPLVDGEQPHVGVGPVSFAMSEYGWVWRIQQNGGGPEALKVFGNKDRAAPAILTRWCLPNGGFALAVVGDEIIVSERAGHEISAWSALTPNTKLRTIIKNPNGDAYVKIVGRSLTAIRTLAERRAQNIIAPEGLSWYAPPPGRPNSEGWIRFGGMAQEDVRQIRLDGSSLAGVCEPNFTLNSSFLTLDSSQHLPDGTGEFGPPGTAITTTWEINHLGRPQIFLPQPGVSKDGRPLTNGDWGLITGSPYPRDRAEIALSANSYDVPEGAGGSWESDGYGSGPGVGPGRLLNGASSYGLHEYVASLPGEVPPDGVRMERSAQKMRARHLNLIYGHDFHGFFAKGQPLPFGVDPDIDYRLTALGFTSDPVKLPPVIEPPTGRPAMFKSVTKTATAGYPVLPNPMQRAVFGLHGSGGGLFAYGDTYAVVCDATMGINDNMPFEFHTYNPGGYNSTLPWTGVQPYIAIQPVDKVDAPGRAAMETNWAGYKHLPEPKVGHLYTHARLDALYAWSIANLPVDPARIVLTGNSMGGWGCGHYGLRRADKFAAIFTTLPRWRNTGLNDWETGPTASFTTAALLPDGTPWVTYMDMVAYVSNPANTVPFVAWGTGKQDAFVPSFQEHIDFVNALRATKRPFVFAWNNGTHSGATATESMNRIAASYDQATFRLGDKLPYLSNSSLDTPFTADVGGINLGFKWRNLTATTFELTNTLGPVEVDALYAGVTKHVSIPAALTWVVVDTAGAITPPPPPTAPTIDSFTASPTGVVVQGTAVTLAWQTTNADSVTITTLGGEPVDGSAGVTPPVGDTTYTLTATGPGGTVTGSVTVSVRALTTDERIARLEAAVTAHGWTL